MEIPPKFTLKSFDGKLSGFKISNSQSTKQFDTVLKFPVTRPETSKLPLPTLSYNLPFTLTLSISSISLKIEYSVDALSEPFISPRYIVRS